MFAPLVDDAIVRLKRELAGTSPTLLAPATMADLKADLSVCLEHHFGEVAAYLLKLESWRKSDGEGPITLLFKIFPGLGQSVKLMMNAWIRSQALLLCRLNRDLRRVSNYFPQRYQLPLQYLVLGLSDPHEHYGRVALCAFRNGTKIIYKPRSGCGEKRWFGVLNWLNREGFTPSFYIVPVLSRREYSWMRFISKRGCRRASDVKRFYFLWGAQVAVSQWLGFADLHHENWIARGSHPVLIDAECFGAGAWQLKNRTPGKLKPLKPGLRSGILPWQRPDGGGAWRGVAPFDASKFFPHPPAAWPMLGRRIQSPQRYLGSICDGYAALVEFISADSRRYGRLAATFRSASRQCTRRVFVRSTQEYQLILRSSLHPGFLLERNSRFAFLLNRCRGTAPWREVALAEARALMRCTVPRFTAAKLGQADSCEEFATVKEMRNSLAFLRTRLRSSAC